MNPAVAPKKRLRRMRVIEGAANPLKVRDRLEVDSKILGLLEEGDTVEVHEIKEHTYGGAKFVRARVSSLVVASGKHLSGNGISFPKHLRGWTTVEFRGQPLMVDFPYKPEGSIHPSIGGTKPAGFLDESSSLLLANQPKLQAQSAQPPVKVRFLTYLRTSFMPPIFFNLTLLSFTHPYTRSSGPGRRAKHTLLHWKVSQGERVKRCGSGKH